MLIPCGGTGAGYDCTGTGCTNNMANKLQMWQLGGTTGTVYNVTFRVRGIVEAYVYVGGVRDAGTASINTNKDLFLSGGAPQPSSGQNYDYNTYELFVTPATPQAAPRTANTTGRYFLNSVIGTESPSIGSSPTNHRSFNIDYEKTIQVPGGGMISLRSFDSNCTLIQNCGAQALGNMCPEPRSISLMSAMPPPPAALAQQPYQTNGRYGQWVHFDVTNVTVAQ